MNCKLELFVFVLCGCFKFSQTIYPSTWAVISRLCMTQFHFISQWVESLFIHDCHVGPGINFKCYSQAFHVQFHKPSLCIISPCFAYSSQWIVLTWLSVRSSYLLSHLLSNTYTRSVLSFYIFDTQILLQDIPCLNVTFFHSFRTCRHWSFYHSFISLVSFHPTSFSFQVVCV